jgi:TatD DNase family protein
MLTDTHCHLDLDKFDADRQGVVQRALNSGVTHILIPGLDLESSLAALILAQSHPNLFAAVGIHPGQAGQWDPQTMTALRELVTPPYSESEDNGKVVAVGEIGLDYYWDGAPHETQSAVLKHQLEFAAEIGKPVILHLREKEDAEQGECADDLMKILEGWVAGLRSAQDALAERPGVLHSFSGSRATAERAIQLGFYIGVTGPITYNQAENRRQLIAGLPLERLLIETDAPYLAPVPQRGKRNEPAFVRFIADKIGEIQSKRPEDVAAVTSANAARLFAWGD